MLTVVRSAPVSRSGHASTPGGAAAAPISCATMRLPWNMTGRRQSSGSNSPEPARCQTRRVHGPTPRAQRRQTGAPGGIDRVDEIPRAAIIADASRRHAWVGRSPRKRPRRARSWCAIVRPAHLLSSSRRAQLLGGLANDDPSRLRPRHPSRRPAWVPRSRVGSTIRPRPRRRPLLFASSRAPPLADAPTAGPPIRSRTASARGGDIATTRSIVASRSLRSGVSRCDDRPECRRADPGPGGSTAGQTGPGGGEPGPRPAAAVSRHDSTTGGRPWTTCRSPLIRRNDEVRQFAQLVPRGPA